MASPTPEIWHFARPQLRGMGALASNIEALGFDGLALTDSQNLSADTYVALTLAAQATSTLKLGPGVTNALTRHPAVTAGAAASLQQVSNGRVVLGIGRGDSSLFNIGHKPVAPIVFHNYITQVQAYLNGESFDQNGYPSQLRWLDPADGKVPLDVAATGPKVIAMGAQIAERISFSLGADVERVSWAVQHARDNAAAREPELGLYVNVCVDDDVARAAEMVRAGVGIFAHFSGMPGATRDRVAASDQAVFDGLGAYDKPRHGHPNAAHAQALSADFLERFAVVGSAERCIDRLRTLLSLGIQRLVIIGPRPDHFGEHAERAIARFAHDVLPALKAPQCD
jgi:5,10-methylenetetrahydromethanopterin reductase